MAGQEGVNADQAALWNGLAGRAWVDEQAALDRMFAPFEPLLADLATAGAHVLDVGCGTGATTLALARRVGPAGRCVGLDVSAAMIDGARARAARDGIPAEFIRADAQVHAFTAASFDAIVSRFGVMFFDDPVRAFANLRQATRPDGRLRFLAWRSAADNPFMTTAERAAAPLLPNLPPRRPNAPGQFAFADDQRVRAILADSGWRDIVVSPIDVECSVSEPDLVGYLTRLGPVGLALQEVDDRTRARVIETVRAAFDPFVQADRVRFVAACWLANAQAPGRELDIPTQG